MPLVRRLTFESMEARRLLAVVDIPDNLRALPQQQVVTPVNIDNAVGVRGAEITLKYDPTILDINQSQIVKGSVWGTDPNVQVTANVDATTGLITVFVSGTEGLPSGSGSLVTFNFTVRSGAALGATTALDLREVRLNEGTITVTPAPQTGSDTTDGVITVGESTNNTISGRVYADVNLNNTADSTEGIPAVTVRLVNTATNAETVVTTAANGEFQFTNVAAGTYRIQQKQPAAFINGGTNEISVTFNAGQALTGQNFREIGLKPEYVYSRLFTTLAMPIGSSAWTDTIEQIVTDAENGVMRAIRVTPASSSDTSDESAATLASSTEVTVPPVGSAGESFDTMMPLSAGESSGDAIDEALLALPDSWTDTDPSEGLADGTGQNLPLSDQDKLLLALLAADESNSDSTADELPDA